MQGWMIALIVIAGVALFVVTALLVGSFIAFKIILGRRREGGMPGETPEKYGVDISWFDTVKDDTQTIELTAYDGVKLRALLIKHNGESKTSRVAVLQHGYWATPRSVQPHAKIFYDKGFDVLLPAARGHNISDGKYVGMAWIDRFDYRRWIDRVIEMYGEKAEIASLGVSMGGSTVIAFAGMNPPPQVKCVIDDCGFSSQLDEYYACLNGVHFPKALAVLPLAIGVRLKCGYSIPQADITQFAKKMTIPALFIHGGADTFVPCELGKKLFDACASSDKELFVVEGATHAASFATDREGYTKKLESFIDKIFA